MKPNMTKNEVIQKLQELAKRLGTESLRQKDIQKAGFYYQVQLNFGGKLKPALTAAGLKPSRLGEAMSTTDEELLQHIRDLQKKLGRPPVIIDLRQDGKFSDRIFETRFGSFPEARAMALGGISNTLSKKVQSTNTNHLGDHFNYVGKAGEMFVISELLYQDFNANLALIDTGIDVIATKNDKTFYFQVKNVSFENTNIRTVPITTSTFINNQKGNMYYMFVLQEPEKKRVLIVPFHNIHQYIQREIIQFDEQKRQFNITISVANDTIKINSATENQQAEDVKHMVDDWKVIV